MIFIKPLPFNAWWTRSKQQQDGDDNMSKATAALTAILALSIGLALPLAAAAQQASVDTSNVRAQDTPVGNLIRVPIERTQINDFVYHVSGLANVYLVNTSEGSIIIDTGFAHQAPRQMELLKEVATGPVKYIFLPQGQHDDVGGIPLVKEAGTEIIMTRSSMEYMPYRSSVKDYLLPRYAVLYSWTNELAEQAKKQATAFPYTPITPDILVEDHIGYQFELGGVKFEVIALPGAEGINSAGLWLPDHKIMFAGGGSVGPEIPMWPNIGTVRADRNRILSRYIDTINTLIELEPEMLLPGQDDPIIGKGQIMADLVLLRDASTYVYDEIFKGLNAGKDVYQLMREIELPENLAGLSQQHGKVEWTVRETVNQTGGWFAYRYTSELYPYRSHEIYGDLVAMVGVDKVLAQADKYLAQGRPVQAIQMVEVALEAEPDNQKVLNSQLVVLQALLKNARESHNTFSEVAWLQAEIGKVNKKLGKG
jgi:alkyl sulfatase BDS1-like metallo-beta-lactamase superfamily hydrolase